MASNGSGKARAVLAASFHPELTDDHRVTAYFVEMVKEAKMKKLYK